MTGSPPDLPRKRMLTVDITVAPFTTQIETICALARERRSAYVCCVNAHMTVEARRPSMSRAVRDAELATADGMPVVIGLRLLHGIRQERVAGNDLMPALLRVAEEQQLSVYFLGGSEATLALIRARIQREHPDLSIAGMHSPPYQALDDMDLAKEAARIRESGAQIILVSLGCPKQELWMARMKGRVNAVMLGLGGAFLLYAGVDTRAPGWMRALSLEWLYRLALEPRRLWKRYLVTNTIFLWMLASALFVRRT